MMQPNVSFNYMYRDAANYKQHGEVIFANRDSLSIEEIKQKIIATLYDGEFFITKQVGVESCFFGDPVGPDDHPWHEFCDVSESGQPASERDIADFIEDLEEANRNGWNYTNY